MKPQKRTRFSPSKSYLQAEWRGKTCSILRYLEKLRVHMSRLLTIFTNPLQLVILLLFVRICEWTNIMLFTSLSYSNTYLHVHYTKGNICISAFLNEYIMHIQASFSGLETLPRTDPAKWSACAKYGMWHWGQKKGILKDMDIFCVEKRAYHFR